MRVLVIEDSDVDFLMVERAIGDAFELRRSSSLCGGLKMAACETFDLVVLDLNVDDSRGFETFEKAHAFLPRVPILILSGTDDEQLVLRAVSNGAQDYIPKSRLLNYPLDRAARHAIQRQRDENTLRESERFARSTVNSLAAHIAILDDKGKILAVNAAWKRFAEQNGMSASGFYVGENYLSVCERSTGECSETAFAAAAGIRQILDGAQNDFLIEYPCHSPTEERWFMMRATPFEGDGPRRVVVSHENITARKIAERLAVEQLSLREAVAGMEHVLGVVGHELRTPLAAIRAISEFLTTDGALETAEADQYLHEISREVCRMSDTVNNILEAARLNNGHARWNWSEIDLGSIIGEAIGSIQPLIDPDRVQLLSRIDSGSDFMSGDDDAIRRLLINLLSNALKHTTEGQIEVYARPCTDENGHWVELAVRDTGCGIPPELNARLGEAFALNSGVVGTNYISGTGMGLAICKGIAKAHGGRLRIDSTPGIGTTVTARLRTDLESAAEGDTAMQTSNENMLSQTDSTPASDHSSLRPVGGRGRSCKLASGSTDEAGRAALDYHLCRKADA